MKVPTGGRGWGKEGKKGVVVVVVGVVDFICTLTTMKKYQIVVYKVPHHQGLSFRVHR
jgi:hypothetical protein